MEKILVTGASGHLGNIVVEHLLKQLPVEQVSVLVREEQKALHYKEKGIEVRVGNYHDPASLVNAMSGIARVLLISSSEFNNRFGQHKNVIDAAKQAGVKHLLYTGVSMKDIEDSPLKPLLHDHFKTEDYIKQQGFSYTFLRNTLYADIIPMFLGANVLETGIFFAAGEGKVAFATRKDLGEGIAAILAKLETESKVYHLSSTQAHSFTDIARMLTELSGKEVTYVSPDKETFERTLKGFGLPEEIVLMSVLFADGMKHQDFEQTDDTLEKLLGHPQTHLSTFLKETFQL